MAKRSARKTTRPGWTPTRPAATFAAHEPMHRRAHQIWPILAGAAYARRMVSYKELRDILGWGGAGVFNRILGHIMHYCLQTGLPVLTSIVVNSRRGAPGFHLYVSRLDAERQWVFALAGGWYRIVTPSADELRAAWLAGEAHRPAWRRPAPSPAFRRPTF